MSTKRKVLLFTDWYLPGFKAGGPIQSCKNIVQHLNGIYDFCIVTSDRDLGDATAYSDVLCDSWTLADGCKVWYSRSKPILSLIKKLVEKEKPDVVYFNSMYSARFTLWPLYALNAMNYKGRIIIAPRGMLHSGAMRRKWLKKKLFLRLLSFFSILKRAHFHATDAQESKDISKYLKSSKILTVPNIPNKEHLEWKRRKKRLDSTRMIFISRIHPKKNLAFALQTMRSIPTDCSIEFNIFGSVDDDNYFNKCKSIAADLGDHITVNFKGPIHPNKVFDTLREHHLFFLPTFGENFGHAIFESLSAGCPALISDQTPWNGLQQLNAGWSLPLQHEDQFTNKIQEVCRMDEKDYNEMSLAAYKFAHSYFSKLDIEKGYSNLFG